MNVEIPLLEDIPLGFESAFFLALRVYGPYPLHKAVTLGHKQNLKFLLEHDLSPNQTNYDGRTPLHDASILNQVECAEILIHHGAIVNWASVDGSTPLCEACAAGNVACVELLIKNGADVNPRLSLSTPLHEACFRGSSDCVELIIKAGASLTANDCHYGTPLHAAAVMNHPTCVRLLLQAGAPVNAIKIHETPLHIAVRENNPEVVKLLLEYGADIYASNNQNKLPIELLGQEGGLIQDMLIHYSRYPAILKDLCRRKIRSVLGSHRMVFIKDLDIPQTLLLYMKHLE